MNSLNNVGYKGTYIVQSLEHITQAHELQQTRNEAAKLKEIKASEKRKKNLKDIAKKFPKDTVEIRSKNSQTLDYTKIKMNRENEPTTEDKGYVHTNLLNENKTVDKTYNESNIPDSIKENNELIRAILYNITIPKGSTEIKAYNLDEKKRGPTETKANTATAAAEKNENKTVDYTNVVSGGIGSKANIKVERTEQKKETDYINQHINEIESEKERKVEQPKKMDDINRKINDITMIGKKIDIII